MTASPAPASSAAEDHARLAQRLEALGRRALAERRAAARWNTLVGAVGPALGAVAWTGLAVLVLAVGLWAIESPWRLPWPVAIGLVALAAPFAAWWRWSSESGRWPDSAEESLRALDARLLLGGRLVAAREFCAHPPSFAGSDEGEQRLSLGFVGAALRDAERRLDGAERQPADWQRDEWQPDGLAVGAPILGLLALALSLWVPATPSLAGRGSSGLGARGEVALLETRREPEARGEATRPELLAEVTPPPLGTRAEREPGVPADPSERGTDLEDEARESKGSFGSGRGAQARRAKGSGQSQGAASDQAPSSLKEKQSDKPKSKPKEPGDDNGDEERKQAEKDRSGATSGAGRGVGSVKNPTASKWESKDQVVTDREEDLEEDPEVEDEASDDENRGGLQPNLRERKPPVNRDLQIAFGVGRKPPPDANGRGGKSGLKKQRGVAQLVLGVPYPDLIRGKPNPGQSKVTQERVEPRSEQADTELAQIRAERESPLARNAPARFEPWMRSAVQRFFLNQRALP
jgi:hypothetical protein